VIATHSLTSFLAVGAGPGMGFCPRCSIVRPCNGGTIDHVFAERKTQYSKGGCCPSFWEDEMRLFCDAKHVPKGLAL
jgi:hypothetical protein